MSSSRRTAAPAGNPDSGKATAFNALAGGHRHVGDCPGMTVGKKEGMARLAAGMSVRGDDLAGACSLSACTPEESVARMSLARERADAVSRPRK